MSHGPKPLYNHVITTENTIWVKTQGALSRKQRHVSPPDHMKAPGERGKFQTGDATCPHNPSHIQKPNVFRRKPSFLHTGGFLIFGPDSWGPSGRRHHHAPFQGGTPPRALKAPF